MNTQAPYQNASFLLEVIHNFVRYTLTATSAQEIFEAITQNFMQTLQIEDCAVFEALPDERRIVQRAAHGTLNPKGDVIYNLLSLEYGQGVSGWVAENQQTVCVADTRKDKRHLVDVENRLSELCVPIQFKGELLGVISAENSNLNFYTDQHIQVFEMIADMAASLLIRIRQQNELKELKEEIENLLEEKKHALYEAIETVSDQVSELKHQRDKREILLREVHHRVNNNLQILSSMVNLYLRETDEINEQTLIEIKEGIQILSSIHLILLKSVENNKHTTQDFLYDLMAAIRYMKAENYLVIHSKTNVPVLNLNTMVPLGLLLYNLIDDARAHYWSKGQAVELNLTVTRHPKSGFFVHLDAVHEVKRLDNDKAVALVLIDALIEQLDGKVMEPDNLYGLWKIYLQEVA